MERQLTVDSSHYHDSNIGGCAAESRGLYAMPNPPLVEQVRKSFPLSQFIDSNIPTEWISPSNTNMPPLITDIIVSNIDNVQPVETAEYWLRIGHYIFDASNGMPLIIGPHGYFCAAPKNTSHPQFYEWFDIGEHKYSFRRQIKDVDWRLHEIGEDVKSWPRAGHQYVLKPGDKLDIETKPIAELSHTEFKTLQYIEKGRCSIEFILVCRC
jgi:hypothetical protein